MNLSELIKTTRESQKKTLMDLSLESGLSIAYVHEIERGNRRPIKKSTLGALGDSLNIPYKNMVDALIITIRSELGE